MSAGSAVQVDVAPAAENQAPFQLRGNSFTMMVLKVIDPASPEFLPQLEAKVRQAPNFFRNAPVVLDFEDVAGGGSGLDLKGFDAELKVISGRASSIEELHRIMAATGLDPAQWLPLFQGHSEASS